MTIDKSNKISNSKYNVLVVNKLALDYRITKAFIRASLRGDRHSVTAYTIRRDYKDLVQKIENVLKS